MYWVISSVPAELDEKLRKVMMKKNKGIHKGDLRLTLIDAARQWIERHEDELKVGTHGDT